MLQLFPEMCEHQNKRKKTIQLFFFHIQCVTLNTFRHIYMIYGAFGEP